MFKKITHLAIAVTTVFLFLPMAFASVSYEGDLQVDYGSKSTLSSSELGSCRHYSAGEAGDEDEEYGFYECDTGVGERDLEDFFDENELEDLADDIYEEYDYYPYEYENPYDNYYNTYQASTPVYNYAQPQFCAVQQTADQYGSYVSCSPMDGSGYVGNYVFYDQSILPKLDPRPMTTVPYGYY